MRLPHSGPEGRLTLSWDERANLQGRWTCRPHDNGEAAALFLASIVARSGLLLQR
jgi:hypothetical protein